MRKLQVVFVIMTAINALMFGLYSSKFVGSVPSLQLETPGQTIETDEEELGFSDMSASRIHYRLNGFAEGRMYSCQPNKHRCCLE